MAENAEARRVLQEATIRANLSDDCVVLLGQLLNSNRQLAEENQKLREEHERSASRQAEVLQRIERRLQDQENQTAVGAGRPNGRSRRAKGRCIAVPPACRVSNKFLQYMNLVLTYRV